MTRFAVFDCDGTLVDSQRRIVAAVEAAWSGQRLDAPDEAAVRRIVGLALPHAIARLAPAGADPGLLAALVEGFRRAFARLAQDPAYEEPLYPGVAAALDALSGEDVALGVATGKGLRGLRMTLERHGLLDRFAVLKTADDGPGKPHPQILEDAMLEIGARPKSTAMLGDTAYDMAMARSAGVHAIGVGWGYHPPEELEAHGALGILGDYGAVAPAVLAVLGPRP